MYSLQWCPFPEPLLASKRVWAGLVSWSLAGSHFTGTELYQGSGVWWRDLCWPLTGVWLEGSKKGLKEPSCKETL